MPLKLNESCITRLIQVVAEGLPKLEVSHGVFLNSDTRFPAFYMADKVIPDNGSLRNQIIKFIDHFPMIEFLSEMIATDLYDTNEYSNDIDNISLVDIPGYTNSEAVARTLVEKFGSLPWEYTLSIRLPDTISELLRVSVGEFQFTEGVRVVCVEPDFAERFPLKSDNEKRHKRIHGGNSLLSLGSEDVEWEEGAVYLQLETEGFIGRYGTTTPAREARVSVRAFCGLAIALRLFKATYKYAPFPSKSHFLVHRKIGDRWEIDGKFEIEDRHSNIFSNIELHDLDGSLNSEVKKIGWARFQLKSMRSVFSGGEPAENILLASQWLFDSYTVQDELLSFVQTMVVLEILLGDKADSEELGLGGLLRNRCAYLIGTNHKERTELLQDFNKIYHVRSQIVHRGKSTLTPAERSLFIKLRWMCRRVIQEEVKLLSA